MVARLLGCMFFSSVLALPIASVQSVESPGLERVNFGFSAAGSVATAPLWVAQDSGAFKRYGLDVKLIFLAGGLAPVAVMTGEVPFALMSAGVMVAAAFGGGDLGKVGAASNYINRGVAGA